MCSIRSIGFAIWRLGKGVVAAEGHAEFFIAWNRIGTFSMLNSIRQMQALEMTIEEVDACTGPAVGWPKSATFRTADIVGLDVLVHVVRNIYENALADESRELYQVPALIEAMIERGWLGEKTGSGFLQARRKKGGESEILTLDWQKMEYRERQKARFGSGLKRASRSKIRASVRRTGGAHDSTVKAATRQIVSCGPRSAKCAFTPRVASPEIADRIIDVDHAMQWGFGWELGPFEIWDAIGVERMARALERDGKQCLRS